MAEPVTNPSAPAANNSNLIVRVHGKLAKIDRYDGDNGTIYTNLIIVPAPDTMKSPTKLEVKSSRNLGRVEEMIDIKATVSSRYWKSASGKVNHTPDLWCND